MTSLLDRPRKLRVMDHLEDLVCPEVVEEVVESDRRLPHQTLPGLKKPQARTTMPLHPPLELLPAQMSLEPVAMLPTRLAQAAMPRAEVMLPVRRPLEDLVVSGEEVGEDPRSDRVAGDPLEVEVGAVEVAVEERRSDNEA